MAIIERGDFIAHINGPSGVVLMRLENGTFLKVAEAIHISSKDESGFYKASYKALYLDENGAWCYLGEVKRPKKHRVFSSREEAAYALLDFLTI